MAEEKYKLLIELAEKILGRKLTEDEKFELRVKYITESGDEIEKAKNSIKSQFSITESLWNQRQANVDDIDRVIRDIKRGKGK